jgi:hypothetical protein
MTLMQNKKSIKENGNIEMKNIEVEEIITW